MAEISANVKVIQRALGGERKVYRIKNHKGLHLFCDGQGGGSWRIRYVPYPRANQRWHTITNDARKSEFDKVQKRAGELLSRLKVEGIDPNLEKDEGIEAFSKTFADWLDVYAKVYKKSWPADERLYERHVKKRIGGDQLKKISRARVIAVLDDIAGAATPIQANRCQSLISAVLSWALDEGRINAHPGLRIRRRGEEKSRSIVMNHKQLKEFWASLNTLFENAEIMLRLLTLLGCRLGELANAEVKHLHLEEAEPYWVMPKESTKNSLAQVVPLTPHACELFKRAIQLGEESPFVFPARRIEPQALDGNQVSRQFKALIRTLGVPDMRLHDLRHQAATGMAECGVPMDIRQHVQNQVTGRSQMIGSVYDQHSYFNEKLHALELWERRLLAIVTGAKLPTERY